MLAIRLKPKGKKKQKNFRVVVDQKQSKYDGKFVEDLGWVNRREGEYNLDLERAKYWVEEGAQPTDAVHNLFVRAGVIDDSKREVHSTEKKSEDKDKQEEESEQEESSTEDSGKVEEEQKEDQTEESKEDEDEGEDEKEKAEEEAKDESEEDEEENNEENEEDEQKEQEEE